MKATKKHRILWATIIIMLLGLLPGISRGDAASRKVRVAVYPIRGFFEKAKDGTLSGYGVDYLNEIAGQTGWEYEFVWGEEWRDCLELLRSGKADLTAPVEKTEERIKKYSFSMFSIGTESGALLARDTRNDLIYEDFGSFGKLRIGCVEEAVFNTSFNEYVNKHAIRPHITYFQDTPTMLAALKAGTIDAYIDSVFTKTESMKMLAKFGATPFYIMCNKENTSLLDELNTALQYLKTEHPELDAELTAKYYPAFNEIPFTKSELEYIHELRKVTIGCPVHCKPLSYRDEDSGEVLGITREILDSISRISGIDFQYTALPEGEITYSYLQKHQISMIASVENNSRNLSFDGLRLTSPYLHSEKVFACPKDYYFDIDHPVRLAIATGSQTLLSVIQNAYPAFQVTVYDDVEKCFEAVRTKRADALLQNQYVVQHMIAKPIYQDMQTISSEVLEDNLCLSPIIYKENGEQNELLSDPRLISILNKAIKKVNVSNLNKIIIRQTTETQYRFTIGDFLYQYRFLVFFVSAVVAVLISVLSYSIWIKRNSLRAVRFSERKLRNITNNINGGVVVLEVKENLPITYRNEGFMELLGWRTVKGKESGDHSFIPYVHPEDRQQLQKILAMEPEKKHQISMKLRMQRGEDAYIPILFNGTLVEEEETRRVYCVIMDISEQARLIDTLSLEQKKYELLMENAKEIMFQLDCKTDRIRVSHMFQDTFGREMPQRLEDHNIFAFFEFLEIHEEDKNAQEAMMDNLLHKKKRIETMARIATADGRYLWCRISQLPMVDGEGNLAYVLGKIINVDEEIREKEELQKKSKIDTLTGVLNKSAFFQAAEEFLSVPRTENSALIFLDIDNFKQVNDQLGHLVGDQAIQDVAEKLKSLFSDGGIIARFGGDEFCVLLMEVTEEELRNQLSRAVTRLQSVYSEFNESVACTASIGAVQIGGEPAALDEIMERADQALYQAKENGKNQYVLFGQNEKADIPEAFAHPNGDSHSGC